MKVASQIGPWTEQRRSLPAAALHLASLAFADIFIARRFDVDKIRSAAVLTHQINAHYW